MIFHELKRKCVILKKAYAKLNSEGASGLLKAAYRLARPPRLQYYPHCESFFQSKAGLEIGGPSPAFKRRGIVPVYTVAARVDNCNFGDDTVWEGKVSSGDTFIFNENKEPGSQYIAEASDLQFIEKASYDFVLSSHCIEHLANPLQGLAEWIRVLNQDGLLVLIVPHKDGTFDHRRPVTSLEHLVQDYENQTAESDMTHLEEILTLHDLAKDPGAGDLQSFEERSKRNMENRCLHQHVFDTHLVVELIDHMELQILNVELFHPYHIVLIAKKISPSQTADNSRFTGVNATPCWSSPFPSDRLNHNHMQ